MRDDYYHFSVNQPPSIKGLTNLQVTPDRHEASSDHHDEENISNIPFPVISQEWGCSDVMEEDDDCDSVSSSILYSPPRKKFRIETYQGHVDEHPADAARFENNNESYRVEDRRHYLQSDISMSESEDSRWWWNKHTKTHDKHKNDCIVATMTNLSGLFLPNRNHPDAPLTCHVCCQKISRSSSTCTDSFPCTLQGRSFSSNPSQGEMYIAPSVNQQEQKQQISLWSYFHPTKKQQSHSCQHDDFSSHTVTVARQQDSTKLNVSSCTLQNASFCCAYCDRPACQSCMRACEGGCNEYYCTFCSTIDYQGVQEKLLCFACRDNNHYGGCSGSGDDYNVAGDHDELQQKFHMDTSC
jgi:hypothetical protein